MSFVENRSQLDKQVRYYTQGSRHGLYFTSEGVVLAFQKGDDSTLAAEATSHAVSSVLPAAAAEQQGASIALRFVGGNPPVVPEALGRVPGEED